MDEHIPGKYPATAGANARQTRAAARTESKRSIALSEVPISKKLPAILTPLARDRDVTIRELPGLNHLVQHARTGAVSEYVMLPETFSPEKMEIIAERITKRFGTTRSAARSRSQR